MEKHLLPWHIDHIFFTVYVIAVLDKSKTIDYWKTTVSPIIETVFSIGK